MYTQKERMKLGKKLIGYALDGFYAFENDEVESFIDKLQIRFEEKKVPHLRVNKLIKNSLLTHPKLSSIIIDVAVDMWSDTNV